MASEHLQRNEWVMKENHLIHVQDSSASEDTDEKRINLNNVSTLDCDEERSYDEENKRRGGFARIPECCMCMSCPCLSGLLLGILTGGLLLAVLIALWLTSSTRQTLTTQLVSTAVVSTKSTTAAPTVTTTTTTTESTTPTVTVTTTTTSTSSSLSSTISLTLTTSTSSTTSSSSTTTIVCMNLTTQVIYPTGSGSRPFPVTTGDLNGDKKPDIIVGMSGVDEIGILFNNGNGTFDAPVDYAVSSGLMWSLEAADVDLDGDLDIVVANADADNVGVLLNNGSGAFLPQIIYSTGNNSKPHSLAIADVNFDSKPDIIVANFGLNVAGVLINTGSGTFAAQVTYPAGSSPHSVAVNDINLDGKPDIIVANRDSNDISVLLNTGTGTFASQVTYATGSQPHSVTVGDVDVDGKQDIIVANKVSNTVGVLLNNGSGTFLPQVTYSTGTAPYFVTVGDIDGDSKVDLIVANSGSKNVGVLLNAGNGTFKSQQTYATSYSLYAVTTADVDVDETNAKKESLGHVVLITAPLFGHMIPLLDFAKRLSEYHHVTYIVSASKLDILKQHVFINQSETNISKQLRIEFIGLLDGNNDDYQVTNKGMNVPMREIARRMHEPLLNLLFPEKTTTILATDSITRPIDLIITDLSVLSPVWE
ncbi:unnamed protein product, partial [Adineta ricciae]